MIKLFCVVQELPVKKQNKRGYPKRLEVYPETKMILDRVETTWWRYHFSEECFERSVKKSYKITVHKSYREGGKIKKIQAVIGTFNYYDLAEECIDPNTIAIGIQKAAKKLNVSNESIATVYKGNIIKNLIMDCQSYTKYRPNETTGGIFVSWRRKEELPTGA